MKDFLTITLLSTLLLIGSSLGPKNKQMPARELPPFFAKQKTHFLEGFKGPDTGHVAWAFISGEKAGIAPKTKKDFQLLQMAFLFSPSGLHFSLFFLLIGLFVKKILRQKFSKKKRLFLLSLFYFLPFLAIKRIILMRLLLIFRNHFKLSLSSMTLFYLTFVLSFFLGHFNQSPMSFVFSFLFMGTFISLKDHSRPTILMALFASHLLICFFTFGSLSPLALILNIPYLGFFPLLFMANLFYFGSSYIVLFNWIEPFMRMFIVSVHYGAKLIQGSEWEASLGLLLAVWMILLKKPKFFFAFFLALHCISAKAPTILRSGPF